MTIMTQVAALLAELLESNPRALILDTDALSSNWAESLRRAAPYRIFDTGAGGRSHIGMAAGLAATHEFVPVLTGSADRLLAEGMNCFADMVVRPGLNVKAIAFVEEAEWLSGRWAAREVSGLRAMGNVAILEPANAADARRLLADACDQPGPAYLVVLPHEAKAEVALPDKRTWGKVQMLHKGDEVTILSTGPSTLAAEKAAGDLLAEKIPCRVAHAAFLCPFDKKFVLDAARQTLGIVVAEPCPVAGGLSTAVAEAVTDEYSCLVRKAQIAGRKSINDPDKWVAKQAQAICRETKYILENA